MPGPFDDLAKAFGVPELASSYAVEDFMTQRQRLREARARMIEEQEAPTAYAVEHTDKDGNPILGKDGQPLRTAAGGAFQIGKRRYDENIPAGAAPGRTGFEPTFMPPAEQGGTVEDLDKIDQVIQEAETFMAPGLYRESPHPEIREGESYGEYYARVASDYERQTGENAVRRPVPDVDSVRDAAPDHSSGDGSGIATGTGTRGEDRANHGSGGQPAADDSGVTVERGSVTQPDAAGDGSSERPGATGSVPASGPAPGGEE
jgi:hypothetical protein